MINGESWFHTGYYRGITDFLSNIAGNPWSQWMYSSDSWGNIVYMSSAAFQALLEGEIWVVMMIDQVDLVVSIGIHWYQTQRHRSAQSAEHLEMKFEVSESPRRAWWRRGMATIRPKPVSRPIEPGRWWFLWIVGESSPTLWPKHSISGEWHIIKFTQIYLVPGSWKLVLCGNSWM